jgi:hypothetical protein
MSKELQPMSEQEAEWLHETIFRNTPAWAHILAYLSKQRGLGFISYALPVARALTRLTVKTDTMMERPKTGFRAGTVLATRRVRIFKRGRMIAQRDFRDPRLIKTPYSKIT